MRGFLVFLLACAGALPIWAATVVWAGGEGEWNEGTRWSTHAVPKAGDDVVIAGGQVSLAQATPALKSLVVGGTLTVTAAGATITARRVTVGKGGRMTVRGPVTEAAQACRVTLVCAGMLTVAAGGCIDVDGKGYAGGIGHALDNDPTSAGYGPGAGGYPKIWGASSGGSHGGRGGTPVAMPACGSLEAPNDAGSGGGGGNKVGGGAGGGVVAITAGAVIVDGAITANGADGVGWSYGGGGAGGSIRITCASFGGRGRVSADGGRGSIYAGGGGGGRVAISTRRVGTRGVVLAATGGPNGGGGPGLEMTKNFGEPGTLCFRKGRAPGVVIPHTGRVLAPGGVATPDLRETVFYWMPWKVNTPMITVSKQLYRTHPRPFAAAMAGRMYVGAGLELMERQSTEARDDVHTERLMRFSPDNGRTWSEFLRQPDTTFKVSGVEVGEYEGPHLYDAGAGVLVQTWLRQIQVGNIWGNGLCNCFTYWRLSRDGGRTWSAPKQLRYEAGADFDPAAPLKPDFLLHNQAYFGSNIIRHSNGTLITCMALANTPDDPQNDTRTWKRGSLCFVGRWDAAAQDYTWTPGKRISVSETITSRGMDEPEVAELHDGRVLVIWRISNTAVTPGRKWFSLSRDGGLTLDPLQELKYNDGSGFYSPGSYHRMIRHSVTGKLYWIGNICAAPPSGNGPRYPLVIAEVDERIPALKKHTVSIIDDRDELVHGFGLQFSNFSLLENRETHALELFLTTYGQERDQDSWLMADCYRYTVEMK